MDTRFEGIIGCIRELSETLSERHQKILNGRCLDTNPKTLKEIGKELGGISTTRVSHLEREVITIITRAVHRSNRESPLHRLNILAEEADLSVQRYLKKYVFHTLKRTTSNPYNKQPLKGIDL